MVTVAFDRGAVRAYRRGLESAHVALGRWLAAQGALAVAYLPWIAVQRAWGATFGDAGPDPDAEVKQFTIDGWTLYLTYADLLPALTFDEFRALYLSIKKNGMLAPLLLSQTGQDRHYHVLDGQHRLIIAVALEMKWRDIPKKYRNLLSEEERRDAGPFIQRGWLEDDDGRRWKRCGSDLIDGDGR